MFNLTSPPMLSGDEKNQLMQLRTFLYQMTEQLNMASIQLDEKVGAVSSASPSSSSSTKSMAEEKAGEYNSLKSLILKTADYTKEQITIVNNLIGDTNEQIVIIDGKVTDTNALLTNTSDYTASILDKIRGDVDTNTDAITGLSAKISKEFVAVSDYGSWQEAVNHQLSLNADGIQQTLDYYSRLEAVETSNASFNEYIVATEGNIKIGIVDWEDENKTIPLVGVAIGQDITCREVTVGNVKYAEVNKDKFLATFTSKALKFWQGDQVVAYITNNELYIVNARIIGSLGVGEMFSIRADSSVGFVVEFIGE